MAAAAPMHEPPPSRAGGLAAVLAAGGRMGRQWPGLRAEYAWRPPFEGHAVTQAQRLEVVFSAHTGVALAQAGRTHDVRVDPGGAYVIGAEPTTLLRVREYSDTLEMYPDLALLRAVAQARGVCRFELEPSLCRERAAHFERDAAVLGIAHLLRRACVGERALSDIEASTLAHRLAEHVVARQCGPGTSRPPPRARRLDAARLARVAEYIESRLDGPLALEALAAQAHLSPWHFARGFKAATGLAPHQYVLARRIEWAKRQLIHGDAPVHQVAWTVGFENVGHFRRQFAAHVGVLPGALRAATRQHGG